MHGSMRARGCDSPGLLDPDALFPVWRCLPVLPPPAHPPPPPPRHALLETPFADLINGPLAHIPSGLFAANCAWLACAVIAHNLCAPRARSPAALPPLGGAR